MAVDRRLPDGRRDQAATVLRAGSANGAKIIFGLCGNLAEDRWSPGDAAWRGGANGTRTSFHGAGRGCVGSPSLDPNRNRTVTFSDDHHPPARIASPSIQAPRARVMGWGFNGLFGVLEPFYRRKVTCERLRMGLHRVGRWS